MEKRKREAGNDPSTESDQEQQTRASKNSKGQSAVESPESDSTGSSTELPDEVRYVAAAVAAAAAVVIETNNNLVEKVLIRYYEMKEIREKRQKLNPNVPGGDIHAAEQPQQEDSKKPAQRLGHSQETNSDSVVDTSKSFEQKNHESSSTLVPASSDTSSQSKKVTVPVPDTNVAALTAPHDVLFGRRTRQRNNPGNVRLRELCFTFHEEYKGGSRKQKTVLAWRIFHEIQLEGGRFLKFNAITKEWSEVANDMARQKVASTIRDLPYPLPNEPIRKK